MFTIILFILFFFACVITTYFIYECEVEEMATEQERFIIVIGQLIKEEANKRGYRFPSAIIAQACLESNYGKSLLSANYFNFFGMKAGSSWNGRSVNMTTKEEYTPGTLTTIKDNFRVYDSMIDGVKGYFDFIGMKRYANLKDALSPKDYIEKIKNDGYATSNNYVNSVVSIINRYNLEKSFDFENEPSFFKSPEWTLITALNTIGEDSGFSNRKKIALYNGINEYKGTADQNLKMLDLLLKGELKKP